MTTTLTSPPAPPAVDLPAPEDVPIDVPRRLRARTLDDWASLGGAGIASLALVWVVYEHVLAWSGTLGFLVCWYASFLVLYGVVVSLSNPRSVVMDRLATAWVYV